MLEIKEAKYGKTIKVLNRNESNLVKTNTWTQLLTNINEMQHFQVISKTQNISGGVLYLT